MIQYCNAFVLDKIDGTFATSDYNSNSTGRCGNATTSVRDATQYQPFCPLPRNYSVKLSDYSRIMLA